MKDGEDCGSWCVGGKDMIECFANKNKIVKRSTHKEDI